MKKLLVLGAKLQGTEVIYLAKEAGYHVTVIDRNPQAPGVGLADRAVYVDLHDGEQVKPYFRQADAVIPAVEDLEVLKKIEKYGKETGARVLFDLEVWKISSSKERSNRLFEELGLPVPGRYPMCGFPVIVKPDGMSGSKGVKKACSHRELEEIVRTCRGTTPVIQEYLEGPSYSLEVLGDGEYFCFPQVTEVVVDDLFDAKRIIAPAVVGGEVIKKMREVAETLAKRLKIRGIFDIEVIWHEGQPKLLEIDGRFPSQTPISVYHSTGINMVQMLVEQKFDPDFGKSAKKRERCCLYQQVAVEGSNIEVVGEGALAGCGPLKRIRGFCGAKEILTDYRPGAERWKGAVIVTGGNYGDALGAFETFMENVRRMQDRGGWGAIRRGKGGRRR